MAAPHVSGAYALVLSANPTWSVSQVKSALMNSTDAEALLQDKCVSGGTLNAYKALSVQPPKEGLITVNPTKIDFGRIAKGESRSLSFTLSNTGTHSVKITNATVDSKDFTLSLATPKTVAIGEEIKGNILFTGNQNGKVSSNVIVLSDAQIQPRLSIPLNAEVFSTPSLVVTPERMHFDLNENEIETQFFTLSNLSLIHI